MKVKEMVFGAVLTSLALIISPSVVYWGLPSLLYLTLASHVPSMLAMTISPWVAFMVGQVVLWAFNEVG